MHKRDTQSKVLLLTSVTSLVGWGYRLGDDRLVVAPFAAVLLASELEKPAHNTGRKSCALRPADKLQTATRGQANQHTCRVCRLDDRLKAKKSGLQHVKQFDE